MVHTFQLGQLVACVLLEGTKQTETRFQIKPPGICGTKVCVNGSSLLTKVATMHIYGNKFLKIFPRTEKLGTKDLL